jgi:hypothetical protein
VNTVLTLIHLFRVHFFTCTHSYSDETLGELSATHKNKLGFMITFDDVRDIKDLMTTEKPPAAGDGTEAGDGTLTLDKCLQAFSAGEQLSKLDTWCVDLTVLLANGSALAYML